MITIAIIAIAAAIGIPSILSGKPLRELKASTRDVFGDYMKARSRAVARVRAHFVCMDIDNRRFWLEEGDQPRAANCLCDRCDEASASRCTVVPDSEKDLRPTVSFQSVNSVTTGVVSEAFNTDGTAQAGNATLINNRGQRFRVIISNTGRMQLQRL
jgi:Tfp pilus assembly protein FimT